MNGYHKPGPKGSPALLETMKQVAEHFYGWPGRFLYDCFEDINARHFAGELPIPMLEVTRFAVCQVGHLSTWPALRIYAGILASAQAGELMRGYDAVLHQCCHLAGYQYHNSEPFCALVNTLSPEIGLAGVDAQLTRCIRDRSGTVIKHTDGSLSQGQLSTWPASLRPPGYYERAELPFDWSGQQAVTLLQSYV